MEIAESIREREASGAVEAVEEPHAATETARHADGILDTIESVIVALILAFVFRAFVVEAFVIPTGSMAPGLYGLHGQYQCPACQYCFAYGLQETNRNPDGSIRPGHLESHREFSVVCPNCGWIEFQNRVKSAEVKPDSGDRILVLKWPYDIGGELLGPKRWDTVVFKNPEDGDTNFIKRLLGLPGEIVEIIDGDLYAAPLEAVDDDIRQVLMSPPPIPQHQGASSGRRLDKAQLNRLAQSLRIQRKTRLAQESLWMLHYDHDYPPNHELRQRSPRYNPPRWEPDKGGPNRAWDAATPCIRFEPPDQELYWLRLAGKPVLDTYGYNGFYSGASWPNREGDLAPVSDVRIRFVLFPGSGSGQVTLVLGKGPDVFRAVLGSDGKVTLEKPLQPGRDGRGGFPNVLHTAFTAPFDPTRPRAIEFENVDYRVTLRIDGEEVLATTDTDYAPNVGRLLETQDRPENRTSAVILIGASGMPLELRHVAVDRDVYYRSATLGDEQNTSGFHNPFRGYPGWGTSGNPLLLRRDPPDYFCCGDNSPASKDSRLWWDVCPMLREREAEIPYQYGTVPGDQMIGRAFFVYWPGGLRFSRDTPAVIPNVGRMRIIR